MVPCETSTITKQDAVILWRNKLPWQQESLAKTPYILAFVAHIWKTNSATPVFLLHESDQQAKMKLSAKFKKFCRTM